MARGGPTSAPAPETLLRPRRCVSVRRDKRGGGPVPARRAGRRSDAAGGRQQPGAVGTTSARPGGGGAVPQAATIPRRAGDAPCTQMRRPINGAVSQANGTSSEAPRGGTSGTSMPSQPSCQGDLCSSGRRCDGVVIVLRRAKVGQAQAPRVAGPSQRRRFPGPRNKKGGSPRGPTRQKRGVAPNLPGRPLLVRAAARQRCNCPAARRQRPLPPDTPLCRRRCVPGS